MKSILIYDNFLNEKLFIECLDYSNISFDSNKDFHSNKDLWNKNIVEDSENIYIKEIDKTNDLYIKINEIVKNKMNIESIKCLWFYWYMPCSHIPWHNDGHKNGGITIYLNNYWNKNNGGLFLYENEITNQINAIVPKKNMAIQQIGGVLHSVCPTTKSSEIRKTIQIFY